MPKKSTLLATLQSSKSAVSDLPERMRTPDFLVPAVVRNMGLLAGAPAENILDEGDADHAAGLLQNAYLELADMVATLLDLLQIPEVSEEALHSVTHRLAAKVDPLLSLHARVDHLYRSYRQGEEDNFIADAQKLWTALEFRAEQILGFPLADLFNAPAA